MRRFRRSLTAFDTTQVHVFDNLSCPYPRIVQAALLRPQVHPPRQGIGNGFDESLAIHLHATNLS